MEADLQSHKPVPSPISTGGGGERFEQHVDAFALALLLAQSTSPLLLDSTVVEVHLQTRHQGWQTDDLLIVAEAAPGVTRKLAIQAKRHFTIAAGDEDCVRTIRGMWDDFICSDRFNPDQDRLAVATLQGSTTLLGSFATLLDCARASATGEDFRQRLGPDSYLSKKALAQNAALLCILGEHVSGELNDDLYWRFLQVFSVMSLDLGTSSAQTEALVLTLLAHVAASPGDPNATARATWAELLDIASKGRESAASYRRNNLPPALLARHNTVPQASERGRLDLIAHGKTVRHPIRTKIGGDYHLDRSRQAAALFERLDADRIVVVSGAAGSGKSALVKALLERVERETPVFAFQAVEFATAHINETLLRTQSALNADALLSLLAAHDRTTIFVDGLERLLEHSVRDAFTHLLHLVAAAPSLQLVMTCRDYSLEMVRSALLVPAELAHVVFAVGAVTADELDAVAKNVRSLAPALADTQMRSFLGTPYLLNMASRIRWESASLPHNVRAFREKCWQELVRDDAHTADGMPARREAAFLSVARQRAIQLRPYVRPATDDAAALEMLRQESLLDRSPESDKLFAPAHDVLEDWGILKSLDDVSLTADDPAAALAQEVGGFPAMRRGLRRWLAERLETDVKPTAQLVLAVSKGADLPQHFRDDCVIAALLSDAAPDFLADCRDRFAGGDTALLRQVIHLLRVACKTAPPWLPKGELASDLLVPVGPGWTPTLEFVASEIKALLPAEAALLLGLVEDWSRQVTYANPAPLGAAAAGHIVSELVPLFDGYDSEDQRKRALQVLLKIPRHAPLFHELATRACTGDRRDRCARAFGDLVASTLSSTFACREFPDVVFDILRARLVMTEADLTRDQWSPLDVDECFGIREGSVSDFFPASALQGPFRALLGYHPQKAVAFIIELLNHAGDWYGLRRWPRNDLEPATRVTLEVPGIGPVKQWTNDRMFVLYRGMSVGPHALQSALMALENWLLELAGLDGVDVEGWLLSILRYSNNTMATGVVASVCIAHPRLGGRAALALLSARDLIECDRHRMASESSMSLEFLMGLDASHAIYEDERRVSNALSHRREDLETLALRLQLTDLRDGVWALIDAHRSRLPTEQSEDSLVWRLALHRMDMRGFRPAESIPGAEGTEVGGEDRVYLVPGNIEPEIQSLVDSNTERMASFNRHLRLLNSARAIWEYRTDSAAEEWRSLLTAARQIGAESEPSETYLRGGPGIMAAACLRDHLRELTAEELSWCAERIVTELTPIDDEAADFDRHSHLFGPDRAAAAVANLVVTEAPSALRIDPIDFAVRALTHRINEVAEYAYAGTGSFINSTHGDVLLRCAAAAVREAEVVRAQRSGGVDYEHGALEGEVGIPSSTVESAVRSALVGSVEEAGQALAALHFETWEGRKAARRICKLLGNSPEMPEARDFFKRLASWLAYVRRRDRHDRSAEQRDYATEYELSRLLAKFVLKLPDPIAREVCAPLADLITSEPNQAAHFIQDLIVAADDDSTRNSFWAVWQDFADRAVAAPWAARLNRDRPYEAELIQRLFLVTFWKDGVTHWKRLDGEAERIHLLAGRFPASVVCVQAYGRFLYTIGQRSLPDAFIVWDAVLRRGDAVRIASNSDVAFYLESLLGRFVYAQPHRLKSEPQLRDAVLHLLDTLVAAGSSAAYRMRDDFVTPLRTRSA